MLAGPLRLDTGASLLLQGEVTFRALLSGEANGSHFMCRMRRPLAVRLKPDTTTALSTRSEDWRL